MNATEWEYLIAARDALLKAGHGKKAEVTRQAAATLGCSVATLYRKLDEAGLYTGRKRRLDAGSTAMSTDELEDVSGLLHTSDRDNGKQLMPVEVALGILEHNGRLENKLSPSYVAKLLADHRLHRKQLAQQRPATSLRSLHPNHVWQIDSSTCVLYYMRSGQLASMDSDEFYRNKPQNFARVASDLCTRYAVADHTSGAFKVRYFLGGESAQNLVDFFLYCVTKQDCSPMHGVPAIVMLDPGAANKGHLFTNLCRRMQVTVVINKVGNARAKGSVEKTHDVIERHLEGRFRFMRGEQLTLESINLLAEQWAAAHCSTAPHTRHHLPRYSVWMQISPLQLRVPASIEVLRELVTSAPESRRVDNTMCISFSVKGLGSLSYDVSLVPGAVVGGRVVVSVNAYRAPAIDVRCVDVAGEEYWQTVEPIARDAFGFDERAPVIGEAHCTARNTQVDENRNRITQAAYRSPGGAVPSLEDAKKARKRHEQAYAGLDAMADVKAVVVPTYLPRRGTALDTPAPREVVAPAPREVVAPVLSVVEACKRLKAQLGDDYPPSTFAWLTAKFPHGVPEEQLVAIASQLATTEPTDSGFGGLHSVGGIP